MTQKKKLWHISKEGKERQEQERWCTEGRKLDETGVSLKKKLEKIIDTIECTIWIGVGISSHSNESSEVGSM
jgi:hypothetical protein